MTSLGDLQRTVPSTGRGREGKAARWRAWAFAAPAVPGPRPEEVREFEGRLLAALRVGHGVRARFRIRVDVAAEPRLLLMVDDLSSERWVARTLLPAYGSAGWTSHPSPSPLPTAPAILAWRVRAWPHALRLGSDGSLFDLIALAAPSAPQPLTIAADLLPIGSPRHPRWSETAGDAASNLGRPRPAEWRASVRGRGPPATEEPPFRRPLFWSLSLSVYPAPEAARGEEGNRALELLARAGHSAGGGGIEFRRARRRVRRPIRGFPVSEEELRWVLPTPSCPLTRAAFDSSAEVLPLGRLDSGRVVGPPIEAHQGRHLAVLGGTGMGKSSLLISIARRVATRYGLVLFDPFGDTAHAVDLELAGYLGERILRVDPVKHPRGLNALEGVGAGENDAVRAERRLTDLVHALRRVRAGRYTDSAYWGPRLEEVLTRALRAASAIPGGTLVEAHDLLATGARRPSAWPSSAMGAVRELAERIRERPEDAEGARRLVYEVVRSPVLRQMLCARSPDLTGPDLVAPGRVVLVSGEASRVGEATARYLLQVHLALLWSELMARPGTPKTFVVLDEAQWFAHDSLAEMLRLGRRANVHLVVATQAAASLPEAVGEALWTNVSDLVAFRGSPAEARDLSRISPALGSSAVLALPRGRAALMLGKGASVQCIRTARIPALRFSPEPRAPPEASGVDARAVLDWLGSRAAEQPGSATFRVPLEELRALVDPGGAAVRAVGSILGRSGAIRSVERSGSGPVWLLDPGVVLSLATHSDAPAREDGAGAPQPY